MLNTLITNNCWGGVIYNNYGMEFKSPTINLQILPEEFPDFCENLEWYMSKELTECKRLNMWHRKHLINMFQEIPKCPLGRIGDILVVFQHYESFEEAKEKWDERKKRVDYDSIGYLFHVKDERYSEYAREFINLKLPNSVCITEDFSLEGAFRFDVPEGKDAFGAVDDCSRRLIEQNFKIKDWLEGRL